LNASYEVLSTISWQRAVTMVVRGQAEVHEADESRFIRSARVTLPFPRVVRLLSYVYVKYVENRGEIGRASKRSVLQRDRFTCAYCGGRADTVDHVQPESRTGRSTWENLVAACKPCNARKGARTPAEAGMRLRWQPYRPDLKGLQQRKLWKTLPVPA